MEPALKCASAYVHAYHGLYGINVKNYSLKQSLTNQKGVIT